MNLNMEIGKKKEIYPSKKTINLYYQEKVSSKIYSIVLDIVFVVVVVFGLLKFLVFDVLAERNDALQQLTILQRTLDQQLVVLQDFDEVAEEYARYSYKILVDEMENQDRMEILSMLESTVFKDGSISNVSISGNMISLSFRGLNLDECAQLIKEIQSYEMVENVVISNQTGNANGTYEGNVTISVKKQIAGGEQ